MGFSFLDVLKIWQDRIPVPDINWSINNSFPSDCIDFNQMSSFLEKSDIKFDRSACWYLRRPCWSTIINSYLRYSEAWGDEINFTADFHADWPLDSKNLPDLHSPGNRRVNFCQMAQSLGKLVWDGLEFHGNWLTKFWVEGIVGVILTAGMR